MVKVVEAKEEHKPGILKLLRDLDNGRIDKKTWADCLNNPFDAREKSPGFVLLDEDQVVGFFGTIYSSRLIGNHSLNFCNTHSWIVLPKYRNKGLLLLSKIQKLKGYVLTNFSASSGPYMILKKMGWKEKKAENAIILKKPAWSFKSAQKHLYRDDQCEHLLTDHEKHIYDHHKNLRCHINVISDNGNHSMNIFKSVPYVPGFLKKLKISGFFNLKLGQLYYVSDADLFFGSFKRNINLLSKTYGWSGLIIPSEYCTQYNLKSNRPYMKKRPLLYRTDVGFDQKDLDLLFSEIFVLDLN